MQRSWAPRSPVSPTGAGFYGKFGRTSAAGLVRRARELGLEVPANVEKSELRAFIEEAERRRAQACEAAASSSQVLEPAASTQPAVSTPSSVAELKARLRELGYEIPSNIIEKSELRALVAEAERHLASACGGTSSPSRASQPRSSQQPSRPLCAEPPHPWRRKESRSRPGLFYYANAETGETTWEPWFRQELEDIPGRHFYLNVETGEATLEPPSQRWRELCAREAPGPPEATSVEAQGSQTAGDHEEEEPPAPEKVDYRDNAFHDGYHAPSAGTNGEDSECARKPSKSSVALPVACEQGDQGVKSLSVRGPTDNWEQSPAAEVVKGSKFSWIRGPLVGRGSLGRVFKARDQGTGMILAVKEVPINRRDKEDEAFRSSLENEISIMQDLEHPHIVSYLGHDYVDGCLFLYLEHMAGGTLTQALNEFGPFEEFLIAGYSRQLLQGLEYLHTRDPPIIHRDIKGSNILIGSQDEVKLADFGCSKRTDETLTHTMRGSIPWMAPEVIAHSRYGRGADIWSFGCVQIEMGTANVPWGKFEHQMQALVRIGLSRETPPLPKGVSELCRDFVGSCVRRDSAERPSASELLGHAFLKSTAGGS